MGRCEGIGYDHLCTLGGRDRYIAEMVTHQERLAKVQPVVGRDAPKAAFGGGKYRTPQPAGPKSQFEQREEFREVSEAFRRVVEVHRGGRKSTMNTRAPEWQRNLAAKLSQNRKLGSKQTFFDAAHQAELYHQQRRIANGNSLTERKKNRLDPELFPVYQMRKPRSTTASAILSAEVARRAAQVQRSSSAAAGIGSTGAATGPAPTGGGAPGAPLSARTGVSAPTSGRAAASTRPVSASAATRRGMSAPSLRSGRETQRSSARGVNTSLGDVSLGKPTQDAGTLRRRLLEQIVNRRLFRESELRPFLLAVVRANTQMDSVLLKEAVRDVEREFFLT